MKNGKKTLCLMLALVLTLGLFAGCASGTGTTEQPSSPTETTHTHSWSDANCTTPKTCSACGETEGEALGHTWTDANCTTPKTCSVCGETEGEALGHTWTDATCTTPKTCPACDETEGEALGHTWADATCTAPKTCKTCGTTDGSANGHNWKDATCTAPKTCGTCGATEGDKTEHKYVDGTCSVCGDSLYVDPAAYIGTEFTLWSTGTYNGEKKLYTDEVTFKDGGQVWVHHESHGPTMNDSWGVEPEFTYEGVEYYCNGVSNNGADDWVMEGSYILVTDWYYKNTYRFAVLKNGNLLDLDGYFIAGAELTTDPDEMLIYEEE